MSKIIRKKRRFRENTSIQIASIYFDESDLKHKELFNTDFLELIKKTELRNITIMDYFEFADTCIHKWNNYEDVSIFFSAKYDRTDIEIRYSLNTEKNERRIDFFWDPDYDLSSFEDWEDMIGEKMYEEVVPDIINKLLSL